MPSSHSAPASHGVSQDSHDFVSRQIDHEQLITLGRGFPASGRVLPSKWHLLLAISFSVDPCFLFPRPGVV
jgi:hypothetical protein